LRVIAPLVNGKSISYASYNYDKESIALNLKQPADRAMFEQLLATADMLVENYRPDTMEKLGYGWDTLHTKYPQLIYGAVSGFGDTGPLKHLAAYDLIIQAMGGIMSVTGRPDDPPTRVGLSIGDMASGLYLATGLLAALHKRNQGGGASKIDIAMLDCQVQLAAEVLAPYLATGVLPTRRGSRHPLATPFQLYRTSDAYIAIATVGDHLFSVLCEALGRPDMQHDPKYATNTLRYANIDDLEADIEQTLQQRTTQEWLEILHTAGIACGPVNTMADVIASPQVAARNMIVSMADPVMGTFQVPGCPIKIVDVPERPPQAAPELDADREKILAELTQMAESKKGA